MAQGFTYNDLATRARSFGVTGDDEDGVAGGPCRVFGMFLTCGSDDASLTINNALTAAGGGTTVVLKCEFSAKPSDYISFGETGIRFDTGLSVATTGTSPTWVVTYMLE